VIPPEFSLVIISISSWGQNEKKKKKKRKKERLYFSSKRGRQQPNIEMNEVFVASTVIPVRSSTVIVNVEPHVLVLYSDDCKKEEKKKQIKIKICFLFFCFFLQSAQTCRRSLF
jgi:hypothetical protein